MINSQVRDGSGKPCECGGDWGKEGSSSTVAAATDKKEVEWEKEEEDCLN